MFFFLFLFLQLLYHPYSSVLSILPPKRPFFTSFETRLFPSIHILRTFNCHMKTRSIVKRQEHNKVVSEHSDTKG